MLTEQEARQAICSYDWDCDYFMAVAKRESHYTPSAINLNCDPRRPYMQRCYGMLQIWDGWAPPEVLLDLWGGLDTAYSIYLLYGKDPWGG